MTIKYFSISFVFLFAASTLFSQTKLSGFNVNNNRGGNDSSAVKRSKGFDKLAAIDMYLQLSKKRDSSIVDTTLTIKKDYKFNYLQEDNFGLMPFANIGQTYNRLTYNTSIDNTLPLFGARAKHFNYKASKTIKSYEVPTPWTRLTYKTAFEQGQMLDAFFTINLVKQFNFSIAYKGLRSLGNYQNVLTSSGNFRFTTNYSSKNSRYKANGHIVAQDILNNENGGLKDEDIENFRSNDKDFLDRSVFDPNFENAENLLKGKQFSIFQTFQLIKKDTIAKNTLAIESTINFEDKFYQFKQDAAATSFFGNSFTTSINDKATLENFTTQLGFNYNNNLLGTLKLYLDYTNSNYGYNSVAIVSSQQIPSRIKTDFFGISTSYSKRINKFNINGEASVNISDVFKGSYLKGTINFTHNKNLAISAGINISSKLPNYNYLLNQSDYVNYNWYNLENFKNENRQQINFVFNAPKYLNAAIDLTNISNYTYFNLDNTADTNKIIKPTQYNKELQYLRLKLQKEFKVGKFALDNTIMYQNTVSDQAVLNVPDIIIRNTLYYTNQLFKKAMTLQTGITLNYFTKYKMNGYDPLIAEFYTQNETNLGGFPRLDFFINAKIRQTRIFLKAEHFNSSFTGRNYFSSPNHPYRDFTIRFGLVWDFFL